MDLIYKLEDRLKYQWTKANQAKSQDEIQRLRAEALETYRLLKKQKAFFGIH